MLKVGVKGVLDCLSLLSVTRYHQDQEFLIARQSVGVQADFGGCDKPHGSTSVQRNEPNEHGIREEDKDKLQRLTFTMAPSKVSSKSTYASWIRYFKESEGSQGELMWRPYCYIGCLGSSSRVGQRTGLTVIFAHQLLLAMGEILSWHLSWALCVPISMSVSRISLAHWVVMTWSHMQTLLPPDVSIRVFWEYSIQIKLVLCHSYERGRACGQSKRGKEHVQGSRSTLIQVEAVDQ